MNKKFSELESAGALTGGELLAVSQKDTKGAWQSRKLSLDKVKEFIPAGEKGPKGDAGADGVSISDITIETEPFVMPDP